MPVLTAPAPDLTLVLDIGKTNVKLLMVDTQGVLCEQHSRPNKSVTSELGYPVLDLDGLRQWVGLTLRGSANAKYCGKVIASTHGAAFVGLSEDGLAWAPLDYEFDVRGTARDAPDAQISAAFDEAYQLIRGPFSETLAPDLPVGLNAARQLYWMQHRHPQAWANTQTLLPYPQYWAWWLSGVRASERSSLGCHTQLWCPQAGEFSNMAKTQGWDALFAPCRYAWEVLGPLRPDLAQEWGLPQTCQVHVGVHDSNACLARYIEPELPGQLEPTKALTVVSSGTWTILMALNAPVQDLHAESDMLGNVDVLGRTTPTARFMGGREFDHLLGGAAPDDGSMADLQQLIDTHTRALPSFASDGGPFRAHQGQVLRGALSATRVLVSSLSAGERATLAALYCAQVTSWLVKRLWQDASASQHVLLVEGPLAQNTIYMSILSALLPDHTCYASTDTLEGTARGAWQLCHWQVTSAPKFLNLASACAVDGLREYHERWLIEIDHLTP